MESTFKYRRPHFEQRLAELTKDIGNTSLFEIWPGELPNNNRLFAKAEFENPAWSHYDRVYAHIFEHDKELLASGQYSLVFDASSGSAGASLAWFCGQFDLPCEIIVPRELPPAFIKHIQSFNPNVNIRSPRDEISQERFPYMQGTVREYKKRRIEIRASGEEDSVYFPNHTDRMETVTATADIGREAIEQIQELTGEDRLDHFIVACGNGASIVGTAQTLKKHYTRKVPDFRVTAFEPIQAPHGYEKWKGEKIGGTISHRLFGTGGYGIELPFIDNDEYGFLQSLDEVWLVDEEQIHQAEELRFKLEHVVGRTSLVSLKIALDMMQHIHNQTFLVIFYDRGLKYGYGR